MGLSLVVEEWRATEPELRRDVFSGSTIDTTDARGRCAGACARPFAIVVVVCMACGTVLVCREEAGLMAAVVVVVGC